MYVLMREGVYQQGIFGVFSNKDESLKAGVEAINREHDDYHQFFIYEMDEDKLLGYPNGRKLIEIRKRKRNVEVIEYNEEEGV